MDWLSIELTEAIQTEMASNALTKYLNVKAGRLLEEYHVGYENKAKHSRSASEVNLYAGRVNCL